MSTDTYDSAWVTDWASSQTHVDAASSSWKVLSEVMTHFPYHGVDMGQTDQGKYQFTISGPVITGDTFYINP